jgi:hypothetical protein
MRRKILFMSTMFSLIMSFSAMAKTIYTPNSNGGYDTYNTETGCTGWIPNTPITVGNDSSGGNSTSTNGGGSTWTENKEDKSTKNSSVSVTGSATDNSSKTDTKTENVPGNSVTKNNGSGTVQGTTGSPKNATNIDNLNENTKKNESNGSNAVNTGGLNTSDGNNSSNKSSEPTGSNESTNGRKVADYVDANGKIIKEKFKNSVKKVELGKDGNLVIYSYDEEGNVVTQNSNYTTGFTSYTYHTDSEGDTHSLTQKVSVSDDYIVEETFLYYTWDMINLTNNQSKYYGYQVQVAKTTSNSTKVQPDLDGTYKIIGTPWYRKDYYKEITYEEEGDCDEFGNCDTDTYTERVLVDSKIVAKSSDEYTAKVPLFCNGCPVPVICVNGACDCASTLNAICDEANKADLIIKERVELEK